MYSLLRSFAKPVVFGTKLARNLRNNKANFAWMRNDIMNMGPAYIKIGQFVATRDDIFPAYITTELSDLHDNVNPLDFGIIKQTIQNEYDENIEDIFLTINHIALSTASIGQVHLVTLVDYPTFPLVMKVQKPNVRAQFQEDFNALRILIDLLKKIFPENRTYNDFYNIVIQCEQAVQQELDYTNEINNLNQMRKAFKNSNIRIPKVISSLSTHKIILMEYIQTSKLTTISADDQKESALNLMKSIVLSGMKNGLIHGDLHPGNIGVLNDKFVLYDCGLLIRLNPDILQDVFSSILSKNNQQFMDTLLDNKLVYIDDEPIGRKQLERVLFYVIEYIDDVDIGIFFRKLQKDPLLNTGVLKFHIDPDMFLISRTFSLLEGTCKSIDRDFSYNDLIFDMITDTEFVTGFVNSEALIGKALIDIQTLTRINFNQSKNIKNETFDYRELESTTDTPSFSPLEMILFVLLVINLL